MLAGAAWGETGSKGGGGPEKLSDLFEGFHGGEVHRERKGIRNRIEKAREESEESKYR